MNAPLAAPISFEFAPGLDDALRNVVVGGGFGGCAAARRLSKRRPEGCRLVLVSEESYPTFHPLLAEVVGATIFLERVIAPLRRVVQPLERARFVMGRVNQIDVAARTIGCDTLAGGMRILFDRLVLAFGNLARADFLPGFGEFALPLKNIGDALEIRNSVLRRVARIELETGADTRTALGHFVVVGGGFYGAELAGVLVDFLRAVLAYCPGVRREELHVTLVQDQERLLPEMPAPLREAARASLQRRGVDVRLGARAVSAGADRLTLADGDIFFTRTLKASAGTKPQPLALESALPLDGGRILVGSAFSVVGAEGLSAIGDCVLAINGLDGRPSPPTALFAVRQGELLADNQLRWAAGSATRPFRHRAGGILATVGRLNGVAEVFGIRFGGLPAWLLWRAFYLSRVPTLGRKICVWAEWTWAWPFSADITHFRFARSETDS